MTQIKIDKDVPLPPRGNMPADILAQMDIGDSVFIDSIAQGNNAASRARVYGHRHGKKFAQRQVNGGVRIWRIE